LVLVGTSIVEAHAMNLFQLPGFRAARPVAVTLAVAAFAAACGPSAGVIGTIAPAQASSDPSVVQSPDATPPPSAGPSSSPSVAPSSAPSSSGPAGSAATPTPTVAPSGSTVVRAYFNLPSGLVPILRSVPETKGVARAALNSLLAGPTAADGTTISTAVPANVSLLGISIAGTTATVDLSSAFASGGSTAGQISRVAQVVYTLTQFANVSGVKFQVEGAALPVPDGKGTIHTDAVGRADYRERLPAIFVDRPAWRAAIGNPARVTGISNVFEATFRVRLIDGAGRTLVDQQVMATCGSGCWGTFDVTLAYTVPAAQWGTLRVYNPSAKDGTPEDVRNEPVWLTAAG
jgi:germination protein M